MDRLQLMMVFIAVAEEESFARGATRINMSAPAVTRAIAALETRLGVKLLTRTTRYVRVTDTGQQYLDHARRIVAEVDAADEAIVALDAAPQGHLAMTASVLFGKRFVAPAIVDYLTRYPDTDISAMFVDRMVNLIEENVDVAVRIGALPDSSMNAVGVGHVHNVVCASPAYLAEHGTPREPRDLLNHIIVHASAISAQPDWKFVCDGQPLALRVYPRLVVSGGDTAIDMVASGFGVTRVQSYLVAQQIEAGELTIILADCACPPQPVHILYREGRQASAKIRTFVDFMSAHLRTQAALR
ncbi:LysR substrate-binding domain-containing protein [Rugamonas sp.]|uniref:LysR substrate-binding domain-containing protein n=1 Tax=Rugamonas sp. TaxID=1926287 RepID=UPI0025E526D7|nr:LysR substrate-binding domain-containing protein [Rugamonas sp.]